MQGNDIRGIQKGTYVAPGMQEKFPRGALARIVLRKLISVSSTCRYYLFTIDLRLKRPCRYHSSAYRRESYVSPVLRSYHRTNLTGSSNPTICVTDDVGEISFISRHHKPPWNMAFSLALYFRPIIQKQCRQQSNATVKFIPFPCTHSGEQSVKMEARDGSRPRPSQPPQHRRRRALPSTPSTAGHAGAHMAVLGFSSHSWLRVSKRQAVFQRRVARPGRSRGPPRPGLG